MISTSKWWRRSGAALCVATLLAVGTVPTRADPPPPQDKGPAAAPPKPATPDTPQKRAKLLRDHYAQLASAADEAEAKTHADAIQRLWAMPASDTVAVLMDRATRAANDKRFDLALNLMGVAVELAPDQAEVWNRRAYIHYLENDIGRAIADLRRTVALDPSHFKALEALGQILKEVGEKKGALAVYRRLLEVHPFWEGGEQAISELEREVEGQSL
jgi:tetratricopeptide (TPR) repeat protein